MSTASQRLDVVPEDWQRALAVVEGLAQGIVEVPSGADLGPTGHPTSRIDGASWRGRGRCPGRVRRPSPASTRRVRK